MVLCLVTLTDLSPRRASLSASAKLLVDFIGTKMTEVVVTAGAIRPAKLQSNRHHQQANTQLFTCLKSGLEVQPCEWTAVEFLRSSSWKFWHWDGDRQGVQTLYLYHPSRLCDVAALTRRNWKAERDL